MLPRQFHGFGFDKDVKDSVLEKLNGGNELQVFKEGEWIIWLGTLQSFVMNSSLSDFRMVYKDLFD